MIAAYSFAVFVFPAFNILTPLILTEVPGGRNVISSI